MKTNTIFKRTATMFMAFTMLIMAVCGFTAINASAAENEDEIKIVRTISDENATAYIYENGYGTIELHKAFTKENPLTSIDGVPLKEIMQFDGGGYIDTFYITTNKIQIFYDYIMVVKGCGPSELMKLGQLHFFDESGDDYNMFIFLSSEREHLIQYNSDKPTITRINWWTTH